MICGITECASTAQITSGGRTHSRRLLVELDSLRAPEPLAVRGRGQRFVRRSVLNRWVSQYRLLPSCTRIL